MKIIWICFVFCWQKCSKKKRTSKKKQPMAQPVVRRREAEWKGSLLALIIYSHSASAWRWLSRIFCSTGMKCSNQDPGYSDEKREHFLSPREYGRGREYLGCSLGVVIDHHEKKSNKNISAWRLLSRLGKKLRTCRGVRIKRVLISIDQLQPVHISWKMAQPNFLSNSFVPLEWNVLIERHGIFRREKRTFFGCSVNMKESGVVGGSHSVAPSALSLVIKESDRTKRGWWGVNVWSVLS